MAVIVGGNAATALFAQYWWPIALCLMFVLGIGGGGYMVTNFTLMLETIGRQESRLGATAFNGWPLGIVCMAFIGIVARNPPHSNVMLTDRSNVKPV